MRSFFGDCDKNVKGEIVNTNPMWTKEKVIADMKENIRDIEHQESSGGFIDPKARAKKMARKTKLEKTLKEISASDPRGKVKGKDIDAVSKAVNSFVEEVKNLNPTRYDEQQAMKGSSTINPTLQGHNSKRPCIKLKNEKEIEFAKSCNMKIDEQGKVSGDDMTRGIWLLQRILRTQPDHQQLKREYPDGYTGRSNQVAIGNLPDDMVKASK